jgi:orotate phosphoribosyltransferase
VSSPETTDVARRIRQTSRLEGDFVLRSGVAAQTYFDKYLFESDPRLLYDIAVLLADLVPPDTAVLAGLEMGGIPVVTVLSQITGIPAAFVRKEAKSYGTCKYAEGADLRQGRIVLVEDVVSSGGAILDAAAKLAADDINPRQALCVIDRQSGGTEALAQHNLELRPLFTMEQIETA